MGMCSCCSGAIPASAHYPASLAQNQLLQGRCQGNIAQICLFPLVPLLSALTFSTPAVVSPRLTLSLPRPSRLKKKKKNRFVLLADERARFSPALLGGDTTCWRTFTAYVHVRRGTAEGVISGVLDSGWNESSCPTYSLKN